MAGNCATAIRIAVTLIKLLHLRKWRVNNVEAISKMGSVRAIMVVCVTTIIRSKSQKTTIFATTGVGWDLCF